MVICPGFPGGSVLKESACNTGDTGDTGSIPGLGRSTGEGNGNPLQYSGLENSMDRGAWQATVHGVTKSWTWLKQLHFHFLSPIMKRVSLLGVSSRRSCRSSLNHSTSASSALLIREVLDYCDIQLFTLEMNRDHSVIFEIASKYCILDSFVDYDGYYISSKGFLPTVVDIMDIWVNFTHSSPF